MGANLNQQLGLDGDSDNINRRSSTSGQQSSGSSGILGGNVYSRGVFPDTFGDSKGGLKSSSNFTFSSSYKPSSSSFNSSLTSSSNPSFMSNYSVDSNKNNQLQFINKPSSSSFGSSLTSSSSLSSPSVNSSLTSSSPSSCTTQSFTPNYSVDSNKNNQSQFVNKPSQFLSYNQNNNNVNNSNSNINNNNNPRFTYSAPQEHQKQRQMSVSSFSNFSPSNHQYNQPSPIGTNYSYNNTDYGNNNNNNSGPTSPINSNFNSNFHNSNMHASYMRSPTSSSSSPQQKRSVSSSKLLSSSSSSSLVSFNNDFLPSRVVSSPNTLSSPSSSINSFVPTGNQSFNNDLNFPKSSTSSSVWGRPSPQTPPGVSFSSASSALSGANSNSSNSISSSGTTGSTTGNSQFYPSASMAYSQDSFTSVNNNNMISPLSSFNSVENETNYSFGGNNSHVGASLGGSRSAGNLTSRYHQFSSPYSSSGGFYNSNDKVNSTVSLSMVSETDADTDVDDVEFVYSHGPNRKVTNATTTNVTNAVANTTTTTTTTANKKESIFLQTKQMELLSAESERLKRVLSDKNGNHLISKEIMFRNMVRQLEDMKKECALLKLKCDVNNVIFNNVEGELTVEQRIRVDDISKLLAKKMGELQQENELLGVSFLFFFFAI